MPVADPETYHAMLDRAAAGGHALAAINVTSSETLNAALRGFAEADADGIVQVSTGGGSFASGAAVKDMALGAAALADWARRVAGRYPVNVALHTDHCPPDALDSFLRPLLAETAERRGRGEPPLFAGHMFDGSTLELEHNLAVSARLLDECAALDVVLEIEVGVVGGEEDGIRGPGPGSEGLYSSPDDLARVAEALGTGEHGRYLLAAAFGNVHGVYAPGQVELRPGILGAGQDALAANHPGASFSYSFHGGSGSSVEDMHAAIGFGVVKMSLDTDAQYAFTRPVAGHMLSHFDGVVSVDGAPPRKKDYDPRTYLAAAETGMADRVVQACQDLRAAGRSLH